MTAKKTAKILLTTFEFKDSDGHVIRLNEDRARELYAELGKLFAESEPAYIPPVIPVIIDRPWHKPWYEPFNPPYTVTWGSSIIDKPETIRG